MRRCSRTLKRGREPYKKKATKLVQSKEDISASGCDRSIPHGCLEMSHYVHVRRSLTPCLSFSCPHIKLSFRLLTYQWGPREPTAGKEGLPHQPHAPSPRQLPHRHSRELDIGKRGKMMCVCCKHISTQWCKKEKKEKRKEQKKTTNGAAAFLFPPQMHCVTNGCHANEPDRLL